MKEVEILIGRIFYRMLDIDQCPDKYFVPNAFKDTHKCDEKSSYCVPILGRGFETGGYKCECKQV